MSREHWVPLRLPWPLAEVAAQAAVKRRLLALHDGRPDAWGASKDSWAGEIESCGAEAAVAVYTNRFWQPWARRPSEIAADVSGLYEVKWRSNPGWDLILHGDDKDGQLAILVVGALPDYLLCGWIEMARAKASYPYSDPYQTGRPAIWVPPDDLSPMQSLPPGEGPSRRRHVTTRSRA